MKKIFAAIALSAALALSIPVHATGNNDLTTTGNSAVEDILLEGELTNDGKPEITGMLFNTSDNVSYDDVVICVDYYDQDHNVISSENYTIKQDVEQGEDENFSIALDAPEGMFTADYNIIGADTK
jgi:hypothetical protein